MAVKKTKKTIAKKTAARRNTRLAKKRAEARMNAEAQQRQTEMAQRAAKAHTDHLESRVTTLENFIRDAEKSANFNFTKAAEVLGEEVVH